MYYLQAADIYVTPYNNPAQVTSGTLSYAVALGKPVVSTPYVHAMEILEDDHGVLVGFHDSQAMAQAINALLSDADERSELAAREYARGRTMIRTTMAERAAGLLAAVQKTRQARMPQVERLAILALGIGCT